MLVDANSYWPSIFPVKTVSRGFGMSGDSNPSTLPQSHYPWCSQFSLLEPSTQLPSLPASWCELLKFVLWLELNTCRASYTCVCVYLTEHQKAPVWPSRVQGDSPARDIEHDQPLININGFIRAHARQTSRPFHYPRHCRLSRGHPRGASRLLPLHDRCQVLSLLGADRDLLSGFTDWPLPLFLLFLLTLLCHLIN